MSHESSHSENTNIIIIIFNALVLHSQGLKILLEKVKMYVQNDYEGDSETVNVLARHTVFKR